MFVVPNRFGVRLDSSADFFRVLRPIPAGILKLTLVRADGLIGKDRHLFGRATSDPYVVVRCGADVYQTPTFPRSLEPEFNFEVGSSGRCVRVDGPVCVLFFERVSVRSLVFALCRVRSSWCVLVHEPV